MATLNKKGGDAARYAGMSSGNKWSGVYSFVTDAAGKWVDDSVAAPAAVAISDVLNLGVIPAGTKLLGALGCVSDVFAGASSTFDIGFKYVDSADATTYSGTAFAEDVDYFFASLAATSLGRTAANNTAVRPVTLPKDAYLVLTNKVAAQSAVGIIDVIVDGEVVGAK